jgi:hypothetical protein
MRHFIEPELSGLDWESRLHSRARGVRDHALLPIASVLHAANMGILVGIVLDLDLWPRIIRPVMCGGPVSATFIDTAVLVPAILIFTFSIVELSYRRTGTVETKQFHSWATMGIHESSAMTPPRSRLSRMQQDDSDDVNQ